MGNVNVHVNRDVNAHNLVATQPNNANSTGPQVTNTHHSSSLFPAAAAASTAPSAREGDNVFVGAVQHDPAVPPPAYEVTKTPSLGKDAFMALYAKSAPATDAHEGAAKRRPGRPRKDGTDNKSSHSSGRSRDSTPHGQKTLVLQKPAASAAVPAVSAPSSSSPAAAAGQEQTPQPTKNTPATLLPTQEAVNGPSHANAAENAALRSDSPATRPSHPSDATGGATAEAMDIEAQRLQTLADKQKRTRNASAEDGKQSPSDPAGQQRDSSPSARSDDSVSEIDEAEHKRTTAHKRSKKDSHDPNAPDANMAEPESIEQPCPNPPATQAAAAADEPAMQLDTASNHDEDEIKQENADDGFQQQSKSRKNKRRKQAQAAALPSPSSPSSAEVDQPPAPKQLSAKAELLHCLSERYKARYCPASDVAMGVEITVKGLIQRADFIPFMTNTFSYVGYVGEIRREQNVHNLFALLLYKHKPGTREANAHSPDFDPFIQSGVDAAAADLCKIRYSVLAHEKAAKSICINLQYTNAERASEAFQHFQTVFKARADKCKYFCEEVLVKPSMASNRHDIMQARLVGVDRGLMKHSDENVERLLHQDGLGWKGCVARDIVGNTSRGILVTCSPDQLALLAYLQKQAPNLMGSRTQMYFCNSSGLCFKCHSHTHIVKKCPHRQSKQVKACLDCGVVGHSTGECTDTAAKSCCRWCKKHKRSSDHRVKECPFLTRNRETRIDMDALAAVHARAMAAADKAAAAAAGNADQAMDADAAARGDEPAPIQLQPRKPLSYAAIVRNLRPAAAKSAAAKPNTPAAAAADPPKPTLTIHRADAQHPKPTEQSASPQSHSPTTAPPHQQPPAGPDPARLSSDAVRKLLAVIKGLEALLPAQVRTLLTSLVAALEAPTPSAAVDVPPPAVPQPPTDLVERQALEAETRARLTDSAAVTEREKAIINASSTNLTALSLAVIKGAHDRNALAPAHRSFLLAPSNFDVQSEKEAEEKLVIGPSALLPGERGVFARVDLPADQAVCQYAGVLIRDREYAESVEAKHFPSIETEFPTTPIMSLNGHDGFPHTSIYGHHHTFGVTIGHSSESPNCKAVFTKPSNASDIPYRIVMIHTTRPIKAGEELLIDYGTRPAAPQPDQPRCTVCFSHHPKGADTIVSCRGVIGLRGCGNGLHHSCGQIEPNDDGKALLCGWCLKRMLSANSQ